MKKNLKNIELDVIAAADAVYDAWAKSIHIASQWDADKSKVAAADKSLSLAFTKYAVSRTILRCAKNGIDTIANAPAQTDAPLNP